VDRLDYPQTIFASYYRRLPAMEITMTIERVNLAGTVAGPVCISRAGALPPDGGSWSSARGTRCTELANDRILTGPGLYPAGERHSRFLFPGKIAERRYKQRLRRNWQLPVIYGPQKTHGRGPRVLDLAAVGTAGARKYTRVLTG